MSVSIQITVNETLLGALESLMQQYPEAVGAALMRIAERVLDTSNTLFRYALAF